MTAKGDYALLPAGRKGGANARIRKCKPQHGSPQFSLQMGMPLFAQRSMLPSDRRTNDRKRSFRHRPVFGKAHPHRLTLLAHQIALEEIGIAADHSTAASNVLSLAGRRYLIVEDDYLLATDLLRTLDRAGASVFGPVGNVETRDGNRRG